MQCADEPGFPSRPFASLGEGDYACTHCGWMQTSFRAGLLELARCATWLDQDERGRYTAIASGAAL